MLIKDSLRKKFHLIQCIEELFKVEGILYIGQEVTLKTHFMTHRSVERGKNVSILYSPFLWFYCRLFIFLCLFLPAFPMRIKNMDDCDVSHFLFTMQINILSRRYVIICFYFKNRTTSRKRTLQHYYTFLSSIFDSLSFSLLLMDRHFHVCSCLIIRMIEHPLFCSI